MFKRVRPRVQFSPAALLPSCGLHMWCVATYMTDLSPADLLQKMSSKPGSFLRPRPKGKATTSNALPLAWPPLPPRMPAPCLRPDYPAEANCFIVLHAPQDRIGVLGFPSRLSTCNVHCWMLFVFSLFPSASFWSRLTSLGQSHGRPLLWLEMGRGWAGDFGLRMGFTSCQCGTAGLRVSPEHMLLLFPHMGSPSLSVVLAL